MNLSEYMSKYGISNRQAARQLGADRVQVSRWRRGVTRPARDWWARIVEWSDGTITEDVPRAHSGRLGGPNGGDA